MFWLGRNNSGIWGGVCEFSGLFTAGVVGFAPIHLELNTSQGLEEKSMEARERGSKSSLSSLAACISEVGGKRIRNAGFGCVRVCGGELSGHT